MASLTKHPRSSCWSVKFRFGGKQFCKSLGTESEREADRLRAGIERTLADLERGRLAVPDGADFWSFVQSDGKLHGRPSAPVRAITLSDLFDAYFAGQVGEKEANTLETEQLHRRNLERHIGGDKVVKSFAAADVQAYIAARSPHVKPQTIRKEVATLRMLFYRAERLVGQKPSDVREVFRGLSFPKGSDKAAFLTWGEIESQLGKRKVDKKRAKELWDRLFLSVQQVEEFLDWAAERKNRQPVPFLPPMLAAAAHTGARLSELCRSRVEDWDFDSNVIVLREKKKSQKSETFRRVDISPRLASTLKTWFGTEHPGGGLAFCREADRQLRAKRLYIGFVNFVRGSKWDVLRGYHVFRHSFASNLAHVGVDERVVDELMGHQTVEMRNRYRHLFPEQRREAVAKLFGGWQEKPKVDDAGERTGAGEARSRL